MMLQGLANAQNPPEKRLWVQMRTYWQLFFSVDCMTTGGPEQVETTGVGHGVFEEWDLQFKATDIEF